MDDRREYLDKLRSIGSIGRAPATRETEQRVGAAIVRTTEHADGRTDVAVRPGLSRYKAERHKTGRRKGQVAEVRPMREGE